MNSAATDFDSLRVAVAQISPVWLSRTATVEKAVQWCQQAADAKARLVVFGEALIPGYPFWLDRTGGAQFDSPLQKELHAYYLQQAVQIERGDLEPLCVVAREHQVAIMVGCVERPSDRGGHSLYCTLVYIDELGVVQSVHRKLVPTYEERLAWAPGDGHGLRVHELGPFTVGGLNCWENWMPLARAALYGFGEDLHVAVWPGSLRNTEQITPFLAREGRSYVISASALMRRDDIGDHVPHAEEIRAAFEEVATDGGSCIAGPDGQWLRAPVTEREQLLVAELNHAHVRAERQNFDVAGHYARPDVLRLEISHWRQSTSLELSSPQTTAPAAQRATTIEQTSAAMPRLNELTDRGKLIVTLALEAARDLGELEVLPEHLLIAILSEGSGVAAAALGCLGLGYDRLYRVLKTRSGSAQLSEHDRAVRFAEVSHQVLARAVMEAQAHGNSYAGTEHLLIALCKVESERFDGVLEMVDLSCRVVREEIAAIMRHGT